MLVVANHPNALVDPLAVFRAAGRVVRPLAKAPLFEQALIGTVLKGLGGLPVYRRQDDPALTHLNDRTFDAAVGALQSGEAVQIFPEGQSHSGPSLAPLRTGAARIALLAEERSDWRLQLKVVPVGLTYVKKHRFRGRALARVGDAFAVEGYQETWARDPQAAARALTERMTTELERVTLNVESSEDRALIDVADRLYARQKGWAGWRERDPLSDRLPRLQKFARGVVWLRAHDPTRYASLERRVARYHRLLALFGASEGDVPPHYSTGSVVRYLGRRTIALLALLPLALVGVAAWWIPYQIPRLVISAVRPKLDAVATYKLASALLAFPAAWALWILGAWWLRGPGWAVATAAALPAAGLAAIGFQTSLRMTTEDVRIFLRASASGSGGERIAQIRDTLVEEFDEVWAEMTAAGERA